MGADLLKQFFNCFKVKDVKTAFSKILKNESSDTPGFVIFGGKSELDYVQYTSSNKGLILNWPTFQEGGMERLPLFEKYLNQFGFQKAIEEKDSSSCSQLDCLEKGQYIILDDGLYAQAGKDIEELSQLTLTLMNSIFGIRNEKKIKITLEPNG